MATVRPELIEEARQRYDVGPHYAWAYLEYWQRSRRQTPACLEQILSTPDPEPLWFDYAMSTNRRAREFVRCFQPHIAPHARRHLDVGCGFGGCLLAFAERGMDVQGIEIEPLRVELSRANCRDRGLEDCVHPLSILDEGLAERLGTFDVITCLDVIEHVLDVPRALRNMVDLLNPGGVLLLEIPNRDSVAFVAHDGHFNLFGITQLRRAQAIAYQRRFFSFEYDVGDYFPLDYYVETLTAARLSCEVVRSLLHPPRVPARWPRLIAVLTRGYLSYLRRCGWRLPPGFNARLHLRVARYIASLSYNSARRALGRLDSALYERRFLADFWMLVARRPDEAGTGCAAREGLAAVASAAERAQAHA